MKTSKCVGCNKTASYQTLNNNGNPDLFCCNEYPDCMPGMIKMPDEEEILLGDAIIQAAMKVEEEYMNGCADAVVADALRTMNEACRALKEYLHKKVN